MGFNRPGSAGTIWSEIVDNPVARAVSYVFFRSRYKHKGLYLLNEPETALSPSSQLELLQLLSENAKDGHAQFIVTTHSPILLACKEATIYSFDKMPVSTIKYEDTEHFKVYRDFLNHREKYLIG